MAAPPHVVDDDMPTPEPVLISHAVQAVLVAAAAGSWAVLDSTQIAAIITGVATIASLAVAMIARGRVRAARPTDADPHYDDEPRLDVEDLLDRVRDIVADQLDTALTPPPQPYQPEPAVQQTAALPAYPPARDPAWETAGGWTPPGPRRRQTPP